MRCPSCNKFVGNDEQEPEVESVEVEHDEAGTATVTASVRIVNACADCGEELAEASLDLETQETSSERTNRSDGKPGTPSRYRRTFYGAKVEASVTCRCGKVSASVTLEDDVQASGMESLT